MKSRHFVVSVYAESELALQNVRNGFHWMAGITHLGEVVITEIAPNIYVGSALEKQVAEAMTREITDPETTYPQSPPEA